MPVANDFVQKMNSLRLEADENAARADELKAKVKQLEQENLAKEQEITSLTHRNQLLETEVEKLETGIKEAKVLAADGAQSGAQTEALNRRLQVLEEEAENADKTLKETTEKYKYHTVALRSTDFGRRLRQTDVKSGHYERKVQALEQERDDWEAKYEEMAKKHSQLQKDLQELEQTIGSI